MTSTKNDLWSLVTHCISRLNTDFDLSMCAPSLMMVVPDTHMYSNYCLKRPIDKKGCNETVGGNQMHKENQILFFSFLYCICPWFICCFLVLGYLSEVEREKQSTWQSIIAPLQNVPSLGQMKRTQAYWAMCTHARARAHTHTHTDTRTGKHMHTDKESLCHEDNQNVECPGWTLKHRTLQPQPPHQCSVPTSERKGRTASQLYTKPSMQYTMIVIKGFLDIGQHRPSSTYFLFSYHSNMKDENQMQTIYCIF